MDLNVRYRVNRPDIVYESFDEEIVIINLDTGNYYSLGGAGTDIWSYIEGSASVLEIVQRLENGYGDSGSNGIGDAVGQFIEELESEGLVVPDKTGEERDEGKKVGSESVPALELKNPTFVAPALEKFTDMQEFLLVDPIHEIDYGDWPKKPTNS